MVDENLAAAPDEYLDPGYDTVTPDGDNVLTDFCRAEIEGWRTWAAASGGRHGADAGAGTAWADSSCPSFFANPAHWSRPIERDQAIAAVGAMQRAYDQAPGGPYLLYSAYPTPDLRPLGLAPVGHPPLMVRSPTGFPPPAHHPDGLHVHQVATESELRAFEQAAIEGFPLHELELAEPGQLVPSALLDEPRWRLYLGVDDQGRAVATSAAYVTESVVAVTLVASIPSARRRGFGEAMSWAATLSDPDKPALLIASDDGAALYRSMGYLTVLRFSLWLGSRRSADA